MESTQNAEFGRRLVALAELFDVKMSPQRQALYFEALRDLDLGKVIQALNQAVKSCKFMPRPAELRTFAVGDAEDTAETAWIAFRRAMTQAGSYASISVRDAALGETIIAMFGSWPAACASDFSAEMWASKRKEFGRVYRVMLNRNLDGARYLPGISETTNAGRRDWMKFVPVHRLDREGVTALSLGEAENERTQISVAASGFKQMADSMPSVLRLIPKGMDETA